MNKYIFCKYSASLNQLFLDKPLCGYIKVKWSVMFSKCVFSVRQWHWVANIVMTHRLRVVLNLNAHVKENNG